MYLQSRRLQKNIINGHLGASTHLSRRTESGSLTFTVEFCTASRIDVVKEIDY